MSFGCGEGWLGSQGTDKGNAKPEKRPLNSILQSSEDYEKVAVGECPSDTYYVEIQGTTYMGNVATQGWIRPYNICKKSYISEIISPSRFAMAFEQNVMFYNNKSRYKYLHRDRAGGVLGYTDGAARFKKIERRILSTSSYTLDKNDGNN